MMFTQFPDQPLKYGSLGNEVEQLNYQMLKLMHIFAHALKIQDSGQTYITKDFQIFLQSKKISRVVRSLD